jgi:hypothetical protein
VHSKWKATDKSEGAQWGGRMVITSHIFTRSNGQYNHSNLYEIFNKFDLKYWFIINYLNVMLILKLCIKYPVKNIVIKKTKKVNPASNESLWQVMKNINRVSDQLIILGTVLEELTVAELLSKFHVWRKTMIHTRVRKSSHEIHKLGNNNLTEDRVPWYILVMKPTRCTNFLNLFLE